MSNWTVVSGSGGAVKGEHGKAALIIHRPEWRRAGPGLVTGVLTPAPPSPLAHNGRWMAQGYCPGARGLNSAAGGRACCTFTIYPVYIYTHIYKYVYIYIQIFMHIYMCIYVYMWNHNINEVKIKPALADGNGRNLQVAPLWPKRELDCSILQCD